MENTSFLPNPALMVLASTAENHEGARVTGPRFSGSDKEGQPFSASSFTMYRPGEHFGPPLYSPVSPFVRPAVDRSGRSGVGILNPVPSASAFRPLPAETSDNYHSAFSPAKRLKPEDLALKKQRDCNTELSEEGSEADEWKNREKEDRPSSISSINYDTNSETHSETGEHERGTPDSEGRSLRKQRKKIVLDGQTPYCPICGLTLRPGEVQGHLEIELEKIDKLSRSSRKSRENTPQGRKTLPSPSSSRRGKESPGIDAASHARHENYLRVQCNRQARLNARSRNRKKKPSEETICPVCNLKVCGTPEELNEHVELCLKKRGELEDEPVDIEGDNEEYEEYTWAGQTRIRAASLLDGGFSGSGFQVASSSKKYIEDDCDLNVDGDDSVQYGQPQYSEADIIPCSSDEPGEDRERQALRGAVLSTTDSPYSSSRTPSEIESAHNPEIHGIEDSIVDDIKDNIGGSAGEIITALRCKLKDVELQTSKSKCLICMEPYNIPVTSIQCWHVHCESCWLKTLFIEDVLVNQKYGYINKVFWNRGHVFILLDHCRKLVTLDAKPIDHIQEEEREGCLDVNTEYPIVAVITLPSNAVYIVQENGCLQHWSYKADCKWRLLNESHICDLQGAEVTDACFNVAQNTLYWCEKRFPDSFDSPVFCIMMCRQGEDKQKTRGHRKGLTLLHGCPRSKVYPVGHGVLVVTDAGPQLVSVCLLLCTLTGKIEVILGENQVASDLKTHSKVDFKQIIMSCLSIVNKSRNQLPVKCTSFFNSTQTFVQVLADGTIFFISSEGNNTFKSIRLQEFEANGIKTSFEVFGYLGILYDKEIRMYCLSSGRCVGKVTSPDGSSLIGVIHSLLGARQSGFYTRSSLYALQKTKTDVSTSEQAVNGCTFQTDGVKLAFIDRIIMTEPIINQYSIKDKMHNEWTTITGKPADSRLGEIVEPYLKQYWKLHNMLQDGISRKQNLPNFSQMSIRDMVDHLLDPSSHIQRSARQAQLHILSQSYPDDVLDGVMSSLDFASGELSTSQLQKWHCIMTAESLDVAMTCDIAVPMFEQICHLLFKHRPSQLMLFLRRSQQVCVQKVGVSPFIRKRHTLQVYERALRCIPDPDKSIDKDDAVFVTVHLLLTSEVDGSLVRAVRLLLCYKQWSEAVDLLQESTDKLSVYPIIYHMVLSALTENDVLHQFADQIFSILPSANCFDNIPWNKTDQAKEVLCTSADSICVGKVRSQLIEHMLDKES